MKLKPCKIKHKKNQLCYECCVKYQNPDKRCGYPPIRETKTKTWWPTSYCWSYAFHVDGDPKFKNIKKICKDCDLWNKGKGESR